MTKNIMTEPGKRHPTPRSDDAASKDLLALVENSLDDDKAQAVQVINLVGKSDIADYMVIASGTSRRQVSAMSDHLLERIKNAGGKPPPVSGRTHCDWVLIDAGDLIVHLFRPEVRAFYNLEKMWGAPEPETDGAMPITMERVAAGEAGDAGEMEEAGTLHRHHVPSRGA